MRVKKVLFSIITFLCFWGGAIKAYATHVYGGELLYKHVSGNTYQIILTLYGDCSAASSTFNTLYAAAPRVKIYNGSSYYDTVRLDTLGVQGVEVSPVCPKEINNTTCNGGIYPGVRRFVYAHMVTLPGTSSDWRFVFDGSMNVGVSAAGRSFQITNIGSPGNSIIQLEARLNNTVAPNSSPGYTTIPTPFYCINNETFYNQGAVDPNGDSLFFSLVAGVDGNSGVAVNYNTGYTAAQPISVYPGSFSFTGLNGQLTFTPNAVQNALVVNQVSEYRNGVLIGTSQREMTFIVSDNCEGKPPTLKMVNILGGAVTGNNIINICVGTDNLSFGIAVDNPDADTTYITPKNVPGGATLNVVNNNTPTPSINFSWATDTLTTGVYTFYLDVKNNHCPVASRQTIAYTINVTPFPTINAAQVSPTNCIHKGDVQYNLALGYLPRYLTVKQGTDTIANYKDTSGIILDSLLAGNYTLIVGSHPLCQVTTDFVVVDSGKLPVSPQSVSYCKGAVAAQLTVPTYGPSSVITWYDVNNNILPVAPTPSTNVAATYTWYIKEQYKTCISDQVAIQAIIYPLPDVKILTNPSKVCYGDTLYLEASGGVTYTWAPENKIFYVGGAPYTRLVTPGTFKVAAVSEHGCKDSTTITYSKIEPCCQFGYPTAFTPNADGKNDGFKVIAFGHTYNYKLAVYNRWGQLVFLSYDPKQYWDGTYSGISCEPGTYYYFFEGTCLIGTREEHKGDITLIR